jgi:hypothetical protein
MLFLHRQDSFKHPARCRIVITQISDSFPVAVNRYSFGDKVLCDHFDQRRTLDVLRVTASEQSLGRKVRLSAYLDYSLGNLVRMGLFLD